MDRSPPAEAQPAPGRRGGWIPWVLLFVVALLTVPPLAEAPGTGLDPSWKLGLHLARDNGLTVGRDLFFTYGPWGFLVAPLTLSFSLWAAAAAFHIGAQIALFAALGAWIRRLDGLGRRCLAVLPLLLMAPQIEYRVLLALLLGAGLVLTSRKERAVSAGALGMAAATVTLIKFSMGLSACTVVVGACIAALCARRPRTALGLGGGFVVGSLVWGSLALGSPAALGRFLSVSWEISTGYAVAQERGGPLWQPVLILAALLTVTLGLLRDRELRLGRHLHLVIPAGMLLLLVFKHAFVRQETHAFIAFSVGGLLLAWLAVETWGRGARWAGATRVAGAVLIGCGALALAPPSGLPRLPGQAGERFAVAVGAARETMAPAHRDRLRETLRGQLPLAAELRERIGGRSVDVLTVETALVEAWELSWRPRRVLQGYAVATERLDDLDAELFAGARAPERLLVDLQGLDTRHPLMDAPRTWRTIFERYEPLAHDARWMLLGLRPLPRIATESLVSRAEVPLNRAQEVPALDGGRLGVRIRLRPSAAGRLVSLLWKQPEVRLGLASGEVIPPRRIVAATAHRTFPLTFPWAETPADLGALFLQPELPTPRGLALFTGGSWAWKPAEVEFVRVEWSDLASGAASVPEDRAGSGAIQ